MDGLATQRRWSRPEPGETFRSAGLDRHWYAVPLLIFAVTRMICAVLLVVIGRSKQYAVGPAMPPGHPPTESGTSYGDLISNWDGQWYRFIVEHGYPHHLPTLHGALQENQWAFYPLYPSLVRIVMWTGLPYAVAASCVSMAFGAAAMTLLYRMLAQAWAASDRA